MEPLFKALFISKLARRFRKTKAVTHAHSTQPKPPTKPPMMAGIDAAVGESVGWRGSATATGAAQHRSCASVHVKAFAQMSAGAFAEGTVLELQKLVPHMEGDAMAEVGLTVAYLGADSA
mmetsp:Transcript_76187/g.213635  ORF Transcript_76187/g.213635 Transcript_76187/m.213635 type:complete len:120 (-) Transcript_76187:682-1041(-)